jgi:hypothetical protein
LANRRYSYRSSNISNSIQRASSTNKSNNASTCKS